MSKRKVKEVVSEVVKKVTKKQATKNPKVAASPTPTPTSPKPKKAKQEAPAFIERTPIEPQQYSLQPGERRCNILTWNVAGLRGTLKNNKSIFHTLVEVRIAYYLV